MASLIYNSALENLTRGAIDFDTDSFKAMLVTNAYVPDKDAHSNRGQVTNEVSGTGYTAGGAAITPTVTRDNANDRVDVTFPNISWPSSTLTARGVAIYKARGGAASADELVAYGDFGGDVTSSSATFNVSFTSPIRFQN